MKKKKAAGYIRVSRMGPKQKWDDKESPHTQLNAIKKYCEFKGYELDEENDIYEDLDYSGGNDKRPDFQRLFADIKRKRKDIDVIVVYNLSRFARDVLDLNKYLQILNEHEIDFASSQEDFLRTDSSMGKFMINIIGAVAQLQREQIAESVRDNMINAALHKGKHMGGIPALGYTVNPKTKLYEINEDEAKIVRLVFNKYVEGESVGSITKYLTEIKALGREKFSKSTIDAILTNDRYTGDYNYNKKRNISGTKKKKKNQRKDWAEKPNNHPAIISRDLFNEAQEVKKARANGKSYFVNKGKASKHILSGLIECGNPKCKNHYFGNQRKNGKGTAYDYYFCSGKQRHTSAFCHQRGIRVEKLDAIVIDTLSDVITHDYLMKLWEEDFHTITEEIKVEMANEIYLKNTIEELREEQINIIDRISKTTVDSVAHALEAKHAKISLQIEDLQEQLSSGEIEGEFDFEAASDFKKMISGLGDTKLDVNFLKMLDKKLVRKVVHQFIEKITVTDLEDGSTKIRIDYKVNKDNLELILKINKQKGLFEVTDREQYFTLKTEKEEHTFFLSKINEVINEVDCVHRVQHGPPVS